MKMNANARIYMGVEGAEAPSVRARIQELGSVGSRQIADRDSIGSRLYATLLMRPVELVAGRPPVERQDLGFGHVFSSLLAAGAAGWSAPPLRPGRRTP